MFLHVSPHGEGSIRRASGGAFPSLPRTHFQRPRIPVQQFFTRPSAQWAMLLTEPYFAFEKNASQRATDSSPNLLLGGPRTVFLFWGGPASNPLSPPMGLGEQGARGFSGTPDKAS